MIFIMIITLIQRCKQYKILFIQRFKHKGIQNKFLNYKMVMTLKQLHQSMQVIKI